MAIERGLAPMALILSERNRTGLHDNLRTLRTFMDFLQLFLRSNVQRHLFCYFIPHDKNRARH
jgi:hypothetical protein